MPCYHNHHGCWLRGDASSFLLEHGTQVKLEKFESRPARKASHNQYLCHRIARNNYSGTISIFRPNTPKTEPTVRRVGLPFFDSVR